MDSAIMTSHSKFILYSSSVRLQWELSMKYSAQSEVTQYSAQREVTQYTAQGEVTQ
jgi:hypothetical protein